MKTALISVALVLGLTLTACGGPGGAAADGSDAALTIYSGRGEDLVAPLFEQFTADTGIPVDVKYADSSELALLIAEEGDRSPADLFFAQSPGSVGFLSQQGALTPLDPAVTELVDAQYRAEDDTWVGITARQRVLVYNSEELDESELPASVTDLTDPQYKGLVGVAPENGSFQDFVTAFRTIEGDDAAREWLEGMAANESPNYPKNSAIVEAVGRGEIPLGLVNHYYNAQALDEDPSLPSRNYVFPDGDLGSLLLLTTVSTLASTDQPEQAQQFVEYLLSEEGQRYFVESEFEYPLSAGVQPPADLPPLGSLEFPDYDFDDYGEGLQETVDMIADSGIQSS